MIKNYFKIFSINEEFEINLDLLEEKYHNFQKNFHPDIAGIEKIEESILINEGYNILKNPISRASHILLIHGVNIEDDVEAPKLDKEIIAEIITIRENIAYANHEEKSSIINKIKTDKKTIISRISIDIFHKKYDNAAQELMKLKYLDKILKDLKNELT